MPVPLPGHSILRIKRIGICGTDYHAFAGNQPFFSYPRVLGHEICAEIYQSDNQIFTLGQQVTVSPYIYCGECLACRNGKTNCCISIKVMGVHVDGAMREYISVPDALIIDGGGLPTDHLALIEPLAIGAHGVSRAFICPGETVLVIGAGPIGLATADFCRIAGAHVIMMDVNKTRLAFCERELEILGTINPLSEDPVTKILQFNSGNLPTAVFDCTGNLNAIERAFPIIAHGGRMVMIGLQKADITFSHPEFHKKEGTLMSSRNALPADFLHVMQCIKSGLLNVEKYISHRVPFEMLIGKFDELSAIDTGVIKAIVTFD